MRRLGLQIQPGAASSGIRGVVGLLWVTTGLLTVGCPQVLPDEFEVVKIESGAMPEQTLALWEGGGSEARLSPTGTGGARPMRPATVASPNVPTSRPEAFVPAVLPQIGQGSFGPDVEMAAELGEGGIGGTKTARPDGGVGGVTPSEIKPAGEAGGAGGAGGASGVGGAGGTGEGELEDVDGYFDPAMLEPPVCVGWELLHADSCGCGHAPDPTCGDLREALSHRYDFDDEGRVVSDRQGVADAEVVNGELDGRGWLTVGGTEGTFLRMPSKVLSPREDLTIELWVYWDGGPPGQQIFGFGNLDDHPRDWEELSLTLGDSERETALGFLFVDRGTDDVHFAVDAELSSTRLFQLVVAIDNREEVRIYMNGVLLGTNEFPSELEWLEADHAWLGRAFTDSSLDFNGSFFDARIYHEALAADAVALSYELGHWGDHLPR